MSDAYNYIPSFFSDNPKGGALTYEQLQARRKIAAALATRQRGFPKNIGEGLTYLGESLGEMYADRRATADEARYRQQSDATVQRLTQPDTAAPAQPAPVTPPDAGPGPMSPAIDPFGGGFSATEAKPDTQAVAFVPPSSAPPAPPKADLVPPWIRAAVPNEKPMTVEELLPRLARNETGGRRDPYSVIGERSRRGDYPYGKYQVMGENIPKWTKGYLGREMTPEQFLKDPEAQEQVARARGGEYLAKYGPTGAAAAWFAGEKGMQDPRRKDTLGTHVAEYVRRFNIPLVSREQVVASAARAPGATPSAPAFAPEETPPVQLASLGGGMPTPDTAPDPAREAIAQQLSQQGPMQPQPAPPQQVAQAPQPPVGRPVPSQVTPINTAPPPPPQQVPMSPREAEIRRAIGATTDPRVTGQLQPIADRMEAERKFEDARRVKQWESDLAAHKSRTDPLHQAQIEKIQQERAAAERERVKTEARGGVSQSIIDKGVENSVKIAAPLREASVAVNQIEDLLERGIFTGTLGKVELALAKGKQAIGGAVDPRVAQTEQFTASVKPIVAAARAALAGGANISDRDMQAAEQAAGGDITLTKEGIQRIMTSIRTIQLQTAMHHQQMLATAAGGDPAAERTLYGLHGLPMENIIPKSHATVQRLMENADNEHERGLFNSAWKTPGLAEKIITRNRR